MGLLCSCVPDDVLFAQPYLYCKTPCLVGQPQKPQPSARGMPLETPLSSFCKMRTLLIGLLLGISEIQVIKPFETFKEIFSSREYLRTATIPSIYYVPSVEQKQ